MESLIKKLNDAILGQKLQLTNELIKHPVFQFLTQKLSLNNIGFLQPQIKVINENEIVITGENQFLNIPLGNAIFHIYKDPEKEIFDFEWHGVLKEIAIENLVQNNIVQNLALNNVSNITNTSFQDVDFLFTSYDQTFIFESTLSDVDISIPNIGITLNTIGFLYQASFIEKTPNNFLIFSTITLGSTEISTEIKLPSGNSFDAQCWVLKTTDTIVLNDGLFDIVNYFSNQPDLKTLIGDSFLNKLPDEIQKIPEFALTDFKMHFNPIKPQLELIGLTIQSMGKFEIIEGFSIENIGVGCFISCYNSNYYSCSLSFFGNFDFSEIVSVGFHIKLPLNTTGNWIISLEGYANLEKLQDLEKLPFLDLSKLNLPKEWLIVNNIRLEHLEIVFNPIKPTIQSVDFAIAMDSESTLIPGITMKNPELSFKLTFDE